MQIYAYRIPLLYTVIAASIFAIMVEIFPNISGKIVVTTVLGYIIFNDFLYMSSYNALNIKKQFLKIISISIIISCIAFLAEILPEISAKMIVIPILLFSIIFHTILLKYTRGE